MTENASTLRLATRGSMLARMQSQLVADLLEKTHTGLHVELVIVKTTGDSLADKPLHAAGGKGLFVKELELALLAGEADFAVHSFKDVPVTMPLVAQDDLIIAACTTREDPRDALIVAPASAAAGEEPASGPTLADLPPGSRIGTGSLRRAAQLLRHRSDLHIMPIRGNIDTRLARLAAGDYDAIVLAMAGLRRGAVFDSAVMSPLELEQMLPAPGQGALALQCRRRDAVTGKLIQALHDSATARCIAAERAVVAILQGDCHSPIAALAVLQGPSGNQLHLRCAVGQRDGKPPVVFAEAGIQLDRTAAGESAAIAEAFSPSDSYARAAAEAACNSLIEQGVQRGFTA